MSLAQRDVSPILAALADHFEGGPLRQASGCGRSAVVVRVCTAMADGAIRTCA